MICLALRSEKKGRPRQVFCYRTGDETGGTGSGGVKERCQSTDSLLVLIGVALGGVWVPARVGYWDKATSGGGSKKGRICGIHRGCEQGKEGLPRCSAAELG